MFTSLKDSRIKKTILLALTLLLIFGAYLYFTGASEEIAARSEITIGYFPNLTHGTAMVALERGYFAEELADLTITTNHFPDGSLFMDALTTGAIDIGLVGPGPALNRYLQGADVVALAGASTGGNLLVTAPDVEFSRAEDLEGIKIATPALGCTHDLQLRYMLAETDLTTKRRGGSVDHRTHPPASVSGMFRRGQLDAAVVSEPWASRLEIEGEGQVALEWNEVPWEGNLPNTIVVTRGEILREEPELVQQFLQAQQKAISYIDENPSAAAEIIQESIADISEQHLDLEIIESSLTRTQFTSELNKSAVEEMAEVSEAAGFIESSNLEGFFIPEDLVGHSQ